MKKECSIVRDVLPLYLENMVSEDTAVFVKEHLENCSDCAAEWEGLKAGKQADEARTLQRRHDAEVIKAVSRKIARRTIKAVAVVCLVFVVFFSVILLSVSIAYPVTEDNISMSTKTDGGYSYIILETAAGKSLQFESKTEDILNDHNEVCGQRIILYNLQYHNNFTKDTGIMSWGQPVNSENGYMEVVVELEGSTLQISNAE